MYNTQEAILNNMPEITDKDIEEMNRGFTRYLFYRDNRKEGYRECWCSSCNKNFTVSYTTRIEDDKHRHFINNGHNGADHCPKCEAAVIMKQTGRAKNCTNLEEWKRFVFIYPKGKNQVYLICVYANKTYDYMRYTFLPKYDVSAVYYLTPGAARKFKYDYDYTFLGRNTNSFYECRNAIAEPFTKTISYNYSFVENRGYRVIGKQRLENSFMKYSQLEEFEKFYKSYRYNAKYYGVVEIPIIKYLCSYSKYPCIEMMIKMGFEEFVIFLIEYNKPMKRDINWNGTTPQEVFKMTKAQFNNMRDNFSCIDDFKIYQLLKDTSKIADFNFCTAINKKYGAEMAERIARNVKKHKLNLTHTMNYLEKQAKRKGDKAQYQLTANQWTDYISFAEKLNYDLRRTDVIFPKKLKQAHDNASAAVVVLQDKEKFTNYAARYEKLKKLYEYSNGEYQIVIPLGVNDIVSEGKELSHCVGGYAARHIEGKTTILFMRKCEAPNERLVTIEVDDGSKRIRQNYGLRDRRVTKAEQSFIDEWITWVKAGSHRKKNKKSKSEAA